MHMHVHAQGVQCANTIITSAIAPYTEAPAITPRQSPSGEMHQDEAPALDATSVDSVKEQVSSLHLPVVAYTYRRA